MPPSRELTAVIDEPTLREVERDLGLKAPTSVKVTTTRENRCYGTYSSWSRRTRLHLGMGVYERSGLVGVTTEVLITFLHELRHGYQYDHWTDAERTHNRMEADAEEWAQKNAARYRKLVKVRSKYPVSNLGRLAHAERIAR